MENRRVLQWTSKVLVIGTALLLANAALAANKPKILHSFGGGPDGEYLDTELVVDEAGNLYGTTVQGGKGSGTVFRVTPEGKHTVLYNFKGGTDGGEPYKGVTLDADGNLYGTAVAGGSGPCDSGCGVVYKLTNSNGRWTQSVIHTFNGNDGSGPGSPVSFDKHGNIYGTTPTGGANNLGVVHQLKPNGTGGWNFNIIHTFTGGEDGTGGSAGRLLIRSGRIYSASTSGGANGSGVIFEMSFHAGQWQFMPLYAFKGSPDGDFPYSALISDKNGSLYGTTYYGGTNGIGTVYKLSQEHGTWNETVLYSFGTQGEGDSPLASLVRDATGDLYGTTSSGGVASLGVIYKLTPGGTYSALYQFPGSPGLGVAYNGLVRGPTGIYYGTTVHGGTTDDGVLYSFTP